MIRRWFLLRYDGDYLIIRVWRWAYLFHKPGPNQFGNGSRWRSGWQRVQSS